MFTLAKLSATPAYKALPRPPVYFTQKFIQERMDEKTFPNGKVVMVASGKKTVLMHSKNGGTKSMPMLKT